MRDMNAFFETEDGTEIMFEVQGCAVNCSIDIKNADGTFNGTSVLLDAREAKAVGQALIAMAEASLTKGIKHE